MFAVFTVPLLMSAATADPIRAMAFRKATEGLLLKEIADYCGVSESLASRWLREGTVRDDQVDKLPPERRVVFGEEMAARWGAVVLRRSTLADVFSFLGWRPVPVRATLGAEECAPLTRRTESRVA